MTYAIIETGGKQLRVEPGRFYDIELLATEPDQTVTLETVLLVQHNGEVTIGQPYVGGAAVEGTVMRHLRGRKIIVYKMKPKKKTRKKRGHRQEITRLMINSISLNGSVLTAKEAATDETEAATGTPVVEEPTVETATPQPTPEPADMVIAVDAIPVVEEPTVETATPQPTPEPTDMAIAVDATPVVEEPTVETATSQPTPEPADTGISEEKAEWSSSTQENTTETESQ